MIDPQPAQRRIQATVEQVRPMMGVAYVADENFRSWAITRSTRGPGLDTLHAGRPVDITVVQRGEIDFVSEYGQRD